MRDGSHYKGAFLNGEMTGEGERTWEDGTTYKGAFLNGEKHGYGVIEYGSRNMKDLCYKGEFVCNQRWGPGEMQRRDGTLIKGHFEHNHPNGDCQIIYPVSKISLSKAADTYHGSLRNGTPQGLGDLKTKEGLSYRGNFEAGVRAGEGTYYIDGGTYELSS